MGRMRIAIAGAGFSGAVLARELVEKTTFHVTLFEERSHVAGNCHTTRDPETGILVHVYGPHVFHTEHREIWEYVNRFARFVPYTNRVKAVTDRGVFSLPINLLTLNQYFGTRFTPSQARDFLATQACRTKHGGTSFEAQALARVGRDLYQSFFYGYTKKQWGVSPCQLPASIFQRIPVRFSYDDNYYSGHFQGLPREGYTTLVERLLDHPRITLKLRERFLPEEKKQFDHLFFTGPIDRYFQQKLGPLRYRTLRFEREVGEGDLQGNAVINFCEESVPYTRVTEYRHFMPWENHQRSVCFREFSHEAGHGDVPYYPLRLLGDKARLSDYLKLAEQETAVTFVGRLGTYRYLDMDAAIGESLSLARACAAHAFDSEKWPRFSGVPQAESPLPSGKRLEREAKNV